MSSSSLSLSRALAQSERRESGYTTTSSIHPFNPLLPLPTRAVLKRSHLGRLLGGWLPLERGGQDHNGPVACFGHRAKVGCVFGTNGFGLRYL